MLRNRAHKAIMHSLVWVTFSAMCSENQKSLPCIISCSDTTLKLQKDGFAVTTHKSHGNTTLMYCEKNEQGIVHTDSDRILQRLIIPKEQFDSIATIVCINQLLAKLESNRLHSLKNALYISVKNEDKYIIYKIDQFRHAQQSEIEETEYTSDLDASESESSTDAVMDSAVLVGICAAIIFAAAKIIGFPII